MYLYMDVYYNTYKEVRDNLEELGLSFYNVGSGESSSGLSLATSSFIHWASSPTFMILVCRSITNDLQYLLIYHLDICFYKVFKSFSYF